MIRNISRILPGPVRKGYKNLLRYCDIDIDPEKFMGMTMVIGLVVGFAVSINIFILFSLSTTTFLLMFVALFVGFNMMIYLWLILRADGKGKFVENVLPDALLLMAMNIKSGMPTDKALIMAARPEFGPLEKELNTAGKQVLAGKPIKYALIEMSYRIRSTVLDRTMRLVVEGIESGGELSSLLQQTSEEIQNTKIIQGEVRANILMYAIFIFFAVGIGAPLLFGISSYLVENLGAQSDSLAAYKSSQPVFGSGGSSSNAPSLQFTITSEFLTTFAVMSLIVTAFFGGLIIGIVKSGDEKAGIKIVPILIGLSIAVFFAVRTIVGSILPSF